MALFTTLEAIPMGCFLDYRNKMFPENQAPVYSFIYLHAYFFVSKKLAFQFLFVTHLIHG